MLTTVPYRLSDARPAMAAADADHVLRNRLADVERLLFRIAPQKRAAPTGLPESLNRTLERWLRATGEASA